MDEPRCEPSVAFPFPPQTRVIRRHGMSVIGIGSLVQREGLRIMWCHTPDGLHVSLSRFDRYDTSPSRSPSSTHHRADRACLGEVEHPLLNDFDRAGPAGPAQQAGARCGRVIMPPHRARPSPGPVATGCRRGRETRRRDERPDTGVGGRGRPSYLTMAR